MARSVEVRVSQAYGRALAWVLDHRLDATLIALLVLSTGLLPLKEVKVTDRLEGHINDFRLRLTLPRNEPFARRDAFLRRVEKRLLAHREELSITSLLTRLDESSPRASLRVFLKPSEERSLPREEIIERAKSLIPERPGAEVRVGWHGPGSREERAVTVRLLGRDIEVLSPLAEEMARRLEALPGMISVETDLEMNEEEELRATVDRTLAQARGLSPMLVGGTIAYALRGRRLPRFHAPGREVEMWAEIGAERVGDMEGLKTLPVARPSWAGLSPPDLTGETFPPSPPLPLSPSPSFPLDTVADFDRTKGLGYINREDGRAVVKVKALTTRDDLLSLYGRIDETLADLDLPRGYTWEKGERWHELERMGEEQYFTLALSITFVFLLMGVLFESFLLPFTILLVIPFAFLGVYWILWSTGTAFDVMAVVGMVILVGIVVNNAIVMVDLINRLRRSGRPRREAAIEGACVRFRPVLMTALTTIFGLTPMALGEAGLAGIPYGPLGRAVIGGLLTSTLLTLFIVPLAYTLLDDLGAYLTSIPWRSSREPVR